MNDQIKARLHWVTLYSQTNDAGLVGRRCGVYRPTLRLWLRRFQESGLEGLQSRSKHPRQTPEEKATPEIRQHILELRQRRLGTRRIQSERQRLHDYKLARRKQALHRQQRAPLEATRRARMTIKRYAREVPGERVQFRHLRDHEEPLPVHGD